MKGKLSAILSWSVIALFVIFVILETASVIYKNFRTEGYNSGFESGYTEGYKDGYSDGFGDGYDDGYKSGTDYGHDIGYDEGYSMNLMENNQNE